MCWLVENAKKLPEVEVGIIFVDHCLKSEHGEETNDEGETACSREGNQK